MAPKPGVAGGRPHAVSTKLSDDELAHVDAARGSLTRAMFLRMLVLDHRKREKS